MHSLLLSSLATFISLSSSVLAASIATCRATPNWPGWAGIKHAFVFGDSYTQTGFNTTLTAPSLSNPLGNPTYPGWTSSNGPNWIDYLTVEYNASKLLTYNLAYGGATIDSSLVAPYLPTVLSIKDQVKSLWFPAYSAKSNPVWTSKDSLFLVWDGVNDVGNSWYKNNTAQLYTEIFAVYKGLIGDLYSAGARNFALLNTPPVDRAPLTLDKDQWSKDTEKAAIADWNARVTAMGKEIKRKNRDVNVFIVDTNALFTQVLDNPASHVQTAALEKTTSYCDAYQNGTPAQDTMIESCGVPVNQYFWLNSLHPTSPIHEIVAQGTAKVLSGGPNVC